MLAIAGANGAGKSTLVNAIAGWSRGPAKVEGTVLVGGTDLSSSSAQRRTRSGVAMVPEARGAFGDMSVEENLRMVRPAAVTAGKTYSVDDIFDIFPQLRERAGSAVRP